VVSMRIRYITGVTIEHRIFLQIARNEEPTSGLEPLTCSLRVCGQWLPSVADVCRFRINKRFFVLCVAHYCRVLRAG
jgi:hypothetical protein